MPEEPHALALAGPVARRLYEELLTAVRPFGPFREEFKKTSVHLTRGSAFAGVHPRKHHLVLTIKAAKPIQTDRVLKGEQVSRNRWHLDVKLAATVDLDSELLDWLRQAYDLCA